jgi:lipopolysaccharide export system protein LptA
MMKPEYLLTFLLVAGYFSPAYALDGDAEQPIKVEADMLEVDDQNQISTYSGEVSLIQGSLNIQSDKLIIRFDDQGDITLMEMYGEPALFTQKDKEGKAMRGQAKKIDFEESKSTLLLRGDAEFQHDGDLIKSQQIKINTELNSIDAGGKEKGDRVQMLIQPKKP